MASTTKGRWRSAGNSDIYGLADDIKITELTGAAHTIRMDDERIQKKKVPNGEFHNSRPVGKARTRWEDVALRNELQVLGIGGWRTRDGDREEWRRLLGAARAQKGLGHCCTYISVSVEAVGQTGLSRESLRNRPQCLSPGRAAPLEQHCLLSGVVTSLPQVVGRYWVQAVLRQDDSSVWLTHRKMTANQMNVFNPLNPELNPICYLLALLGAHHFLHVSGIRVKLLTFRLLMSYIYGAPILDVSRSHTTTQHSR